MASNYDLKLVFNQAVSYTLLKLGLKTLIFVNCRRRTRDLGEIRLMMVVLGASIPPKIHHEVIFR